MRYFIFIVNALVSSAIIVLAAFLYLFFRHSVAPFSINVVVIWMLIGSFLFAFFGVLTGLAVENIRRARLRLAGRKWKWIIAISAVLGIILTVLVNASFHTLLYFHHFLNFWISLFTTTVGLLIAVNVLYLVADIVFKGIFPPKRNDPGNVQLMT
ncbi:MAG: hypothetical protein KGR98_04910 [Verrucomicrobia bacterium]|nr:hypothetical protein [Verrucomicrobiota bacterium]MDE3100396.1 hypothetical protein [Verrucomicrobiota bacterium]